MSENHATPPANFVHLHVHTQYSLLDGAIRIGDLLAKCKEYGMAAVAITDHGAMFGGLEFYVKAKKAGIKPIIGCEFYISPSDRFDKSAKSKGKAAFHLVLLAMNMAGYKNLMKLASIAQLEGFHYAPRIDMEVLEAHSEGLIALTACLHGAIPHRIAQGDMEGARAEAKRLMALFGDRLYLEMQENKIPEQTVVNNGLKELARELGIPLVATNDCHYLNRDEAQAHELLLCVQTGKTIHDTGRFRFSTDELFFKSPAEMKKAFSHCPEAIAETVRIAERCQLDLTFGEHHFPIFPVPEGETLESLFEREARQGLEARLATMAESGQLLPETEKNYRDRLEMEIDVIKKMGFPGYFLIVADFINWAKDHQIPVGPGRGSAAGSLVAWSMRITDLDPIRYGLIFERFLNTERVSMPDIDVDFCFNRRGEVLQYVSERYGKDHVAQIITFGSMQARAVLRDVGRVMDMPYNEVDQIAKLVPAVLGISLDKAIECEPRLKERMNSDPKVKKLLEIARSLEGMPRHASTHAAGVVIGDVPLNEVVPLYKGPKDETVTQFDMKCVEKAGLIKFDFLGLRTLTVIDVAVRMVRQGRDPEFGIDGIPMDDAETYALLSRGDTTGVFQLESSGMKELLSKMRPECFEDVIALVALYRPGPLESGMVDDFVARKHGEKKVAYLLPQLAPILKETYGVIVYQEQVMEIARVLAGYSLGEGDILRRAMGKKNPEEMASQRQRFAQGAKDGNVDPKKAEQIFDLMEKFAGYGFNKSHSAAYALIAYQTAYLKAHFPHEFMAALLTSEVNNTDAVVRHISECREHELKVLPPDINLSEREFTVKEEAIRFGLAAVKNVGEGAVEAILAARAEGGPFAGLHDLCERVDLRKVNKRVLESLVKCGAFDSTGAHRAQLMAVLDEALEQGQKLTRDREGGQTNMFAAFVTQAPQDNPHQLPDLAPWREADLLAYEKEALGFYITGHPLQSYREQIRRLATLDTLTAASAGDGMTVRLAGLPTEIKEKITKKGDRMAFVRLEDLVGSLEMIVFPDCYAEGGRWLSAETPVLVTGTLDKDERGVKLKATKILPLDQATQTMTTRLRLKLEATGLTRDKLVLLRQTLTQYPGACRVSLHLNVPGKGEAVLMLPAQYRVDPTPELMEQVNSLFGHGVVEPVLAGEA